MTAIALRSIYFDCDSTLATIEGVEELSRGSDPAIRERLRELTEAAMNGEATVEEVYGQRLDLVRPTREMLERVAALYVENAVPFAAEVIGALRALGKDVGIVSGGLELPVLRFAAWLGIDTTRVHAVGTHHTDDGGYVDFDRTSPMCRNGGKPVVVAGLGIDARPIAFVGDGITDLETVPVVDLFVGYGGVERRENVAQGAEVYIDAPDLRPVLAALLTDEERAQLARHARYAELLEAL